MSEAMYRTKSLRALAPSDMADAGDLPCRAEILDAAGLAALGAADWDALSDTAIEDNPFFARQMVLAGIAAMGDGKTLRALVLRERTGGRLAGLFPFRVRGIGPFACGSPALNLYQVGGTPLIASAHAEAAMATLVRLMASGKNMPRHWILPHMALDGPFMDLFTRHVRALGWDTGVVTPYRRAVLTRAAGNFLEHAEKVIGRKRAKDIGRNLRRLGEIGTVTFERTEDPEMVAERVEAFLALEHSGWKGARKTAFLSRPDHAAFARKAFAGGAEAEGLAVVDSLLLDGVPIAVSINIKAGETLFTPKCAFDETYRKYGPGMVLEYLVIEDFFVQARFKEMDAATTIDGHVIAGFWDAEKSMGTVVAGPAGIATRGLCAALAGAARGKARIKTWLRRG